MLLWKNHRTSRGAAVGFVGQNQQFICPMPVTFSIVLIQLSVQVQSSLSLSMSGLSCFSPAPLCAFWSAFLCQYPHWFPFMMNWEVTRLKNCTTATTKIYIFFSWVCFLHWFTTQNQCRRRGQKMDREESAGLLLPGFKMPEAAVAPYCYLCLRCRQ